MITRNEKEGYIDYSCIIKVGEIDGKSKVWVEMKTPEFGTMFSKRLDATSDYDINHQLGESLVDELINEYEFRLKNR